MIMRNPRGLRSGSRNRRNDNLYWDPRATPISVAGKAGRWPRNFILAA
jgi:hypothetical protein